MAPTRSFGPTWSETRPSFFYSSPVKNKPMTKKELIKQVEELEKQVKDLREGAESMRVGKEYTWEPETDEDYFRVDMNRDCVVDSRNISQEITDRHISFGNCFKTRDEAEQFNEWLKARATLIKEAKIANEDWKPVYDEDDDECNDKYSIYYDYEDEELHACSERDFRSGEIVFKSRELAEESIANFEDEWLIYLSVEDYD